MNPFSDVLLVFGDLKEIDVFMMCFVQWIVCVEFMVGVSQCLVVTFGYGEGVMLFESLFGAEAPRIHNVF